MHRKCGDHGFRRGLEFAGLNLGVSAVFKTIVKEASTAGYSPSVTRQRFTYLPSGPGAPLAMVCCTVLAVT